MKQMTPNGAFGEPPAQVLPRANKSPTLCAIR